MKGVVLGQPGRILQGSAWVPASGGGRRSCVRNGAEAPEGCQACSWRVSICVLPSTLGPGLTCVSCSYIPAVVDHRGGMPCMGTFLLHQVQPPAWTTRPLLCPSPASPLPHPT